jgi:hypothetical protein
LELHFERILEKAAVIIYLFRTANEFLPGDSGTTLRQQKGITESAHRAKNIKHTQRIGHINQMNRMPKKKNKAMAC